VKHVDVSDLDPPERATTNLTSRTLSGLKWMYLATAIGAVLQFGMTAVLARLLTPTAFGLIAFAGVFLRFVDYFAKAGITQALIQKPHLSREDVRAAFALSSGLGVAFALLVLLAAPVAGVLGQDPDLVPVLRWLTLGLALQGLGAPATALLRRDLRFQQLAGISVGSYVVGYVGVGLAMALLGAGVWALVGATVTQTAFASLAAYALVRHPLRPTAARSSYRAILRFGARVSVVGFLEFLQSNLDTLAVGRWAGTSQLGLYNRANLLAYLPAQHLSSGFSQVLFPSFAAIQFDLRRLRGAYLSAVGIAAAIVLPLNAGMAVAGREIVLVVLGDQWVGATQVLPWLLLASSVALVGHFAGVVAEAQAALNAKMLVAGGSTVTLVLALWMAEGRALPAYGAALASAAVVSHLGYVAILTRTLEVKFRTLVRPYLPALIAATVVAASIAICRTSLLKGGVATPLVLIAEVLVGGVALALMFRVGPLRALRGELLHRLMPDASERDRGMMRRLLDWIVGQPSS
jgi:lipopolysaccharide exporter